MEIENNFEELGVINTKSKDFRVRYIKEYLKYLLTYFFFAAPINKWYDCLSSSHRIAYDITRAKLAIENEKDCWSKNALRSRFYKWGKSKLNES